MKLSTKEKEVEKSRSELKSITAANHKLIVESEVCLFSPFSDKLSQGLPPGLNTTPGSLVVGSNPKNKWN